MASSISKNKLRRAQRVRTKLRKVADGKPRLSVTRSTKHISVQLIDDAKGVTVAAASSLEKDFKGGSQVRGRAQLSASSSLNAPRKPASPTSCSTAAVTCSMAA